MSLYTEQIWKLLRECSLPVLLSWIALYLAVKLWGDRKISKYFLIVSGCVYLLVLVFLTMYGRQVRAERHYNLNLFWEYQHAFQFQNGRIKVKSPMWAYLIVNNILLFIPMGVLLSELVQKKEKPFLLKAISLGTLSSLLVETIQLIFQIGLFDLDDVLHNSIGCLLGVFSYVLIKKLKTKFTEHTVN